MKRLILCFFGLALAARAQIVQPLFLNSATSPQNVVVNNTGQIGHTIRLQFSNNGGNTCVNPNPTTAELDYSFDATTPINGTWIAFSLPQKMTPNTLTATFQGSGLFNNVRFSLVGFDNVNCVASAWYTGSTQQPTIQPLSPTLAYQPFTNYQGGTTSVSIPSFGQTSHVLEMSMTNIGGQTCGAGDTWSLALTGGVAGSASFSSTIITLKSIGGVGGTNSNPFFGGGAYQTLTLTATAAGSAATHCVLNAWYTAGFGNTLGAVSTNNGLNSGTPMQVPINQCSNVANIAVTAGNTTVILGGFISLPETIRICQIVLTTPTAAAVATLKTSTQGSSCVSGLTTLGSFNMAIGVPITFGGGLGSVVAISPQLDICLQATTGNINGIISYDFQ